MSSPKFMVFKLKDFKLPGIMLLIAIAAFAFFMLSGNNDTAQTFAPSDGYEDGTYIASISLSDAAMDLVVNVENQMISSIALEGFDENERTIYQDLNYSISFVNDYVTSTQSLELPDTNNTSYSTALLMDAVRVALSDDQTAQLTTTYQMPLLENLSASETNETTETDMATEDAADVTVLESENTEASATTEEGSGN